jgi:hypothetical protein
VLPLLIAALLFLYQCEPLLITDIPEAGDNVGVLNWLLYHYPLILNGGEAQGLSIPLALVALICPTLEIAISGGLTGAIRISARVVEAAMLRSVLIGGGRGRIADTAHGDHDRLGGDGWPLREADSSNILVRAYGIHGR